MINFVINISVYYLKNILILTFICMAFLVQAVSMDEILAEIGDPNPERDANSRIFGAWGEPNFLPEYIAGYLIIEFDKAKGIIKLEGPIFIDYKKDMDINILMAELTKILSGNKKVVWDEIKGKYKIDDVYIYSDPESRFTIIIPKYL